MTNSRDLGQTSHTERVSFDWALKDKWLLFDGLEEEG